MPLLFFVLGLFFGSFANVLILRLKTGKKGLFTGRSECPKCHHPLGVLDLVPILSWIFLRGKCRYCGKAIDVTYPLVELGMAVLWGILALESAIGPKSSQWEWIYFVATLIIFSGLFIISMYDLKYQEVPDVISLPLIGILLLALPFNLFVPGTSGLLGAAIGLGFFGTQFLVSHGRWIGGGDLRLGIIMGLLLGWQGMLLGLFLSYLIGAFISIVLLVAQRKTLTAPIAFGPFLALGTFLAFFWGEGILSWYLRFSGVSSLLI